MAHCQTINYTNAINIQETIPTTNYNLKYITYYLL